MNHMDGIENTAFPRENGEAPNMMDVERSRRLYFRRLGVLICFVLIFMDGGSQKTDTRYLHKEETVNEQTSKSQSAYISKLNQLVGSNRNLNAQTFYPRNITGTYHGYCQLGGIGGSSNSTKIDFAKVSTKSVTMKLYATKLKSVPDLDFVYGLARIYSASSTGVDLYYPLQGVFLAATGELHLLSSIEATKMLFLELPDNVSQLKDVNSTPSISISPGSLSEASKAASPQLNASSLSYFDGRISVNRSTVSNRFQDSVESSASSRSRKRRRPRVLSLDTPAVGLSIGMENILDLPSTASNNVDYWLSSASAFSDSQFVGGRGQDTAWTVGVGGLFPREHRVLAGSQTSSVGIEPGFTLRESSASRQALGLLASQSLAVGSTGMVIHLINVGQSPFAVSNMTAASPPNSPLKAVPIMNPNLIQAIGEASLPASFKSMQRYEAAGGFEPSLINIAFGAGAGVGGIAQSCQFSVRLKVPPTETLGDYPRWVMLKHLVANMTNSDARSGAMDVIDKEKAAAIAAASVRKNTAYASGVYGVFESKDCGVYFNITATSMQRELAEVERKASNYSFAASAMCFLQIALLIVQLGGYSRTQAASVKISILCMSAQSMLDAALCIAHLVLCAAQPQVFFSHFMWVAILKLLLFGVFEMRAVIIVYQARYAQEASGDSGMQGLRQRLAKVHLRFYAALFASVFIAFYCRQVPVIAIFIFYSYWIPQIVWNAVCGTRRTFHTLYCVGTTLTRLFIPLYLLGCPNNFFTLLLPGAIPHSPATCVWLVVWSLLQMGMLFAQDYFGPRFFLPANMFPRAYDYYRPVPNHVLRGSHTPQNSSSGSSEELLSSDRIGDVESGGMIECVICYNAVDTSTDTYMITPCDHLFHKACLEQWLSMKMECCICRAVLPPLEES